VNRYTRRIEKVPKKQYRIGTPTFAIEKMLKYVKNSRAELDIK